MVAAGQYAQARAIWASVSNVRVGPGTLLFNSGFSNVRRAAAVQLGASSSTVGLAERRPGGGLHVMFYGQEDGTLARQLLVLPAGSVPACRWASSPGRATPSCAYWTVRCAAGNAELGRDRLDQAARGWTFQVPASCPAQWLELVGSAPDVPRQSDVTIANLGLREGAAGD